MSPASERTFSSREVVRIAGCTDRQLQWWDKQRIVKAKIVKHSRCYTREQVLQVMVVFELRKRATGLKRLRRLSNMPGKFLLIETGGRRRFHWEDSEAAVIERMKKARAGFLMVNVRELRERLEARS
jgi:DNA-binding transcriptional MerR regulator